ncbi:MAG: DNA topoisomerase 3 [Verrucomicrobia bacterium]|jgi:DNA topoisomerase III|nr:DNA topoisomerase 3 [Verrucomicrobiota bacterium]MBT7069158.1 DNA topoisomerase 3 [Verrucomicrobiota bacterium]MBT7702383.1 DNA topoisomerase 3 [Verrucomicrobiota bacterium]
MKVVFAEKPSVGRDIARCIGNGKKCDGWIEGKGWAVTWAFGHLVQLQNPEAYDPALKRWSLETLPIVPEPFQLEPRYGDGVAAQLQRVVDLFKQADELICATDAGREGELIFRYVVTWAGCEDTPVRRLWLSSMTDDAIKRGFKEMQNGQAYDNLYRAARCRSEADWIVGMNGTRFFSVRYGRRKELWSVGRVQTPVLAMIVGRDRTIEDFRSSDYHELHTLYRKVDFKHERGKIEEAPEAQRLLDKVTGPELVITDIQQQRKSFRPPLLYDLTELQRDMNKRWGLTAKQTLAATQTLYERKHLTYPRTDSRYLDSDTVKTVPQVLERLRGLQPAAIAGLDLANLPVTARIVNDAKVNDHHAIIPTTQPPAHPFGGAEGKVYEAVLMRFIAAFYPPCVKSVTRVRAMVEDEPFRASGSTVITPGWQALFPKMLEKGEPKKKRKKAAAGEESDADSDADQEQALPAFVKGERGPHAPFLKQLKTKPPHAFTEASLLQMMETAGKLVDDEELQDALKEKGIGTPATRAAIIETLIQRGYIIRRRKSLVSTDHGRELIDIVADEQLKSPELTGEWEAQLKRIERGEYDGEAFMEQVVAHTRQIISQTKEVKRVRRFGPCPKCEGSIIEGKRGYGCSRWKGGCDFVIWKEQFGTRLRESDLHALLEQRKTVDPILLEVDKAVRRYGRLVLKADNSVGWTPIGAREKVRERAMVGQCPLCGSDVIANDKQYGCVRWREGCPFVVWRTMSQRALPVAMVRTLLKEGITPFIQKFKRRDGKRFDARLKLDEAGKVGFDFTPNEKKTATDSDSEEAPVQGAGKKGPESTKQVG